jgi:hypothetical protein
LGAGRGNVATVDQLDVSLTTVTAWPSPLFFTTTATGAPPGPSGTAALCSITAPTDATNAFNDDAGAADVDELTGADVLEAGAAVDGSAAGAGGFPLPHAVAATAMPTPRATTTLLTTRSWTTRARLCAVGVTPSTRASPIVLFRGVVASRTVPNVGSGRNSDRDSTSSPVARFTAGGVCRGTVKRAQECGRVLGILHQLRRLSTPPVDAMWMSPQKSRRPVVCS